MHIAYVKSVKQTSFSYLFIILAPLVDLIIASRSTFQTVTIALKCALSGGRKGDNGHWSTYFILCTLYRLANTTVAASSMVRFWKLNVHFIAFLRTGGGPPGVLFYRRFFFFFFSLFSKFIFEPKPLFFQIRCENSLGVHPLSFLNFLLVSE